MTGSVPLRRPSDLAREGAGQAPNELGRASPARNPHPAWPAGFVRTRADRHALVVLLSLASVTPRRLVEQAQDRGTATACLASVREGRLGSATDRTRAGKLDGAEILARVEAAGARLVAVHDPEYPRSLLDLFDPPAGLFVRGLSVADRPRRVAIVGARNCSAIGREVTHAMARAVAEMGAWVVSGGARGIDAAAHQGALAAGGRTIAVLGSGVDVAYPRANAGLFARIAENGAIISEYPPGTRPEPFRFPARNRIVAALAEAVVVAEGTPDSGSLITADHAIDLGRELMAVPGPVTSELAAAPLTLLRDGARIIRGPADLLDDLGFVIGQPAAAARGSTAVPAGVHLTPPELSVWGSLRDTASPDALTAATGMALPEVMEALVGLELRGLVVGGGGRYRRRVVVGAGEPEGSR